MLKAVFLSFVLLFVTASALVETQAQTIQQLKLAVKNQKTVTKDKLTVKFVSVIEDSRCPTGANCIWAGNAKIQIKITNRKGVSKIFELNTNLEPQTVKFEGYEIKLGALIPHPKADTPTDTNSYTATFSLTK